MYLKLPADLAQLFANYLSSKPFGEVHQFIAALQALEQVNEEETQVEEKP